MTEYTLQQKGIAILRMIVGLVFLLHGIQKIFILGPAEVTTMFNTLGVPLPGISAMLVMVVEFFGGLALLLGLFTRIVAIPLAFNMLMAILLVHLPVGFFGPQGYEFPLTLLFANVALVLTGAGAWAIDNILFHHHPFGRDEHLHMTA